MLVIAWPIEPRRCENNEHDGALVWARLSLESLKESRAFNFFHGRHIYEIGKFHLLQLWSCRRKVVNRGLYRVFSRVRLRRYALKKLHFVGEVQKLRVVDPQVLLENLMD